MLQFGLIALLIDIFADFSVLGIILLEDVVESILLFAIVIDFIVKVVYDLFLGNYLLLVDLLVPEEQL